MKKITVLGATGSIGQSTLRALSLMRDRYEVFALTAHAQIDKLFEQCLSFRPVFAVAGNEADARRLQARLSDAGLATRALSGPESLIAVAGDERVESVMCAIVGAAGLPPAWEAAGKGKTVLLANKETLVMAGGLFMRRAQDRHARVLPVDSEHNAIFQALPGDKTVSNPQNGVASIIITASGGPFWRWDAKKIADATPQQAVNHPNWKMGRKISVDSATMMNKALEVIEARWLFDAPPKRIEALVHPQSVIHGMVRFVDGSIRAQLAAPDMRSPIAHVLTYPERFAIDLPAVDFATLAKMEFFAPDPVRFPALNLAYETLGAAGEGWTCALNAANEIAVSEFLRGRLRFGDIYAVVRDALDRFEPAQELADAQSVLELDQKARSLAQDLCAKRRGAPGR